MLLLVGSQTGWLCRPLGVEKGLAGSAILYGLKEGWLCRPAGSEGGWLCHPMGSGYVSPWSLREFGYHPVWS